MTEQRSAGIMVPLSSLPGPHGVGDMGPVAYEMVDMLLAARARYWQILPINPLGFGNSPYQPYSSYAGDPLFISLQVLHEQGLLAASAPPYMARTEQVDYEAVREYKEAYLREAFAAFTPDSAYEAFAALGWVRPYAVFMALKRANGMRGWNEWPKEQRDWPIDGALDLALYAGDIRFEMFLQYTFYAQWTKLKAYANDMGVEIIGDIPIYVGIDSQDVWMARENFLLDADGRPTYVAGVPPDYFSATGQRWGNPLYDWAHIEADGFAFWIERLRHCATLFDVVRIDHFRAFDTYWKIPASCPTAVDGEWVEAPGYALFDAVFAALPEIRIIAEDLGMLRDEVYVLRDAYHFRGMKILQFVFDPGKREMGEPSTHMVVYTGTHDNQTTLQWHKEHGLWWRLRARMRLYRAGCRGRVARMYVQLALKDAADMAIIPLADVLGLGAEGRVNTPGTVGSPNWEWKLGDYLGLEERLSAFAGDVMGAGR